MREPRRKEIFLILRRLETGGRYPSSQNILQHRRLRLYSTQMFLATWETGEITQDVCLGISQTTITQSLGQLMLNDLMLEKNCLRWIIELCSHSTFTSIVLSCNLTQKCDYFRMLLHTNSSIKDKEYNYYKHHEKSTCLVFHAEREDMKRKVMDETCFCWKCCWGWSYKVFTGQWVHTCRRRWESHYPNSQ